MKKMLSGIAFICVAVAGLFIMLISRSDKPGIVHTMVSRDYSRITATPLDTVKMPAGIHVLAAYDGMAYALDQYAGIIYRVSPQTNDPEIAARPGLHFTEIPASFQADSAGIHCFAANKKMIFRFPLNGGQPDSLSATALPFSRCARLPDDSFFTHLYDSSTRKTSFAITDYHNGNRVVRHLYDFPHVNDGGLASDGLALPAGSGRQVAYIQFHNADVYLWRDSGLHTFQTIDRTPAENNIIEVDDSWSISSKTQFINIDATADENYLYVLSLAVSHKQQTMAPEVDVYRLPGGEYAGSLRLPSHERSGVRHIAVTNGMLYASHKQHIIAYQLRFP